jgi:hypothetical protein
LVQQVDRLPPYFSGQIVLGFMDLRFHLDAFSPVFVVRGGT